METVERRLWPATPWPFIAWAALLVMQIISPDPAWSWPLVGLSALIAFSYGYARVLRDQVGGRRQTLGTWVVAGDLLLECLTLTNASALPVLWAQVADESDVPG